MTYAGLYHSHRGLVPDNGPFSKLWAIFPVLSQIEGRHHDNDKATNDSNMTSYFFNNYNLHFYVLYVMVRLASKLFHLGLPLPNPYNKSFLPGDQKSHIDPKIFPPFLFEAWEVIRVSMQRLTSMRQNRMQFKNRPTIWKIALDVGPNHDGSLTYMVLLKRCIFLI